jgi:hypothetical protein
MLFGQFTELNRFSTRLDKWLHRCAMPFEPTPIGIEISQTVPDKKIEEDNQLNNDEPNQKTWQPPSPAVNLKERWTIVWSMEIPSLKCNRMPR